MIFAADFEHLKQVWKNSSPSHKEAVHVVLLRLAPSLLLRLQPTLGLALHHSLQHRQWLRRGLRVPPLGHQRGEVLEA